MDPVPRFHLALPLISISSSQYGLKYNYSFFPGGQAEYLWVWVCHGDPLFTPTAALEKLSLRKAESVLVAEQSGVAMDCCRAGMQ